MSNKRNYRTMKVFDCQYDSGMPADVKDAFFRIFEEVGNDVYVKYSIADSIWEEDEGKDYKLLDQWLIDNGAEGPKDEKSSGETVLIHHWW